MQVNQEAPAFKPITIVLETEEEAIALRHIMNLSHNISSSSYEGSRKCVCEDLSSRLHSQLSKLGVPYMTPM